MQIYKIIKAVLLSIPFIQGCEAIRLNVRSSFRMPKEDRELQENILGLKLEKETIKNKNLQSKINRYNRANAKVPNTIAQQDIDDLETELKTTEIELEIIKQQLEALGLPIPE